VRTGRERGISSSDPPPIGRWRLVRRERLGNGSGRPSHAKSPVAMDGGWRWGALPGKAVEEVGSRRGIGSVLWRAPMGGRGESGERTSGSGDTPPAFDRAAAASEWSSTALQLDQSRCRSVGTRRKLSDTDKRSSFTRAWCFVFGRHSPTLSIRFNVSNWVVFILLEFLNVII
jgi:hypothetical protein